MYATETKLRVRYSETDRMGYCYYGNYAQYFEVARVDNMRSLGVSYKSLEDSGVLLPVIDFSIKYHQPAFYDDELVIKCEVPKLPSVKIQFNYKTYIGANLINEAKTTLVFVNKETSKPMRAPGVIIDNFKPFFTISSL